MTAPCRSPALRAALSDYLQRHPEAGDVVAEFRGLLDDLEDPFVR